MHNSVFLVGEIMWESHCRL